MIPPPPAWPPAPLPGVPSFTEYLARAREWDRDRARFLAESEALSRFRAQALKEMEKRSAALPNLDPAWFRAPK